MPYKLLIDLDGTLIDSSEGIYKTYVKACGGMSTNIPSLEEFKKRIGPPITEIFQYFNPNIQERDTEQFHRSFRKLYDSEGYKKYRCYEDVIETLNLLARIDSENLTVVTNKPTAAAKLIVDDLKLSRIFKEVVGIDYLSFHKKGIPFKSKHKAISYVVETQSGQKSNTYYIGDTLNDLKSANSAGVKFIAATYGFYEWPKSTIEKIMHINHFSEIIDLLNIQEK
tara:strand:- start:3675 stop:4349 length:675 start_codon:yes stop_codon:yes gene_type:complete